MIDERKAQRVIRFIEMLKHTKGAFFGKPFELLPWQKDIIRTVFGTVDEVDPTKRQYTSAYVEIPKKQGKALVTSTLIPCKDGFRTMGDLAVGDTVFDENGQPCHVVKKSDVMYNRKVYRLTFRDGSHIDACEDHLWDVEVVNNGKRHKLWNTKTIYDKTVAYRKRHAGTVDEIRSIIRIPVASPIQLPEAVLPLDPYTYGYWLGNGTATDVEITIRTCDYDRVISQVPYEVTKAYPQNGGGSVRARIPALKPVLVPSFRDKVIRPEYLRASEEQRWALLQGLMDSDGCVSRKGYKSQGTYVSTIKQLATSVSELMWTLGIKNAVTASPSLRYMNPTGETLYTVRFTAFDDMPLSRLTRKDSRKQDRVKTTRSCFHYLENIELLPYSEPVQCIQVDSPSRLYLAGETFVPTHNSELGAAIALNMLVNDDEQRAEVYSCAADRNQAGIVFDVACDMVRQNAYLSQVIEIIPSTKRMIYTATGSKYQVLSSDVATKHGLNVSACIFDELHVQPNRDLYDVMTQGSGDARKQPLWFFLTTAGTNRNSICWEVHQKAVDLLEGRKQDKRFYPVIYGIDDNDDWHDEKVWYKANPSLGITIDIEKVRDAYHKALESPADENMFRQLRLNQWVKQTTRWMPMDRWDENCNTGLTEDSLLGKDCYAGLDMSSTGDLTTIVLVFPPDDECDSYRVLPYFWIPEESMRLRVNRDHVLYDQWHGRGFINTTEGNVVHYDFIEQFICRLNEKYHIKEIAYDRWNATMFVQKLEDDGFCMVPFGQGFRDMSGPTKELMRLVLDHKLMHNGHPVLRWNIDNVYVKTDPAGNIKMDKEKSTEKIDGAVAMVMGLDRAMRSSSDEGTSVYDDRGLLFI